jgi:1-acyl-sn-glycerol-3-phosphate acyltransferase
MENVHLTRKWEQDQKILKQSLKVCLEEEGPLLLTLFPEGTVVCNETMRSSISYALKQGWNITPTRCLIPKSLVSKFYYRDSLQQSKL